MANVERTSLFHLFSYFTASFDCSGYDTVTYNKIVEYQRRVDCPYPCKLRSKIKKYHRRLKTGTDTNKE